MRPPAARIRSASHVSGSSGFTSAASKPSERSSTLTTRAPGKRDSSFCAALQPAWSASGQIVTSRPRRGARSAESKRTPCPRTTDEASRRKQRLGRVGGLLAFAQQHRSVRECGQPVQTIERQRSIEALAVPTSNAIFYPERYWDEHLAPAARAWISPRRSG